MCSLTKWTKLKMTSSLCTGSRLWSQRVSHGKSRVLTPAEPHPLNRVPLTAQDPGKLKRAAALLRAGSRTWAARQRQEPLLLQQAVVLQQAFCSGQLVLCQPLTDTKLAFFLFKKGTEQNRQKWTSGSGCKQFTFGYLTAFPYREAGSLTADESCLVRVSYRTLVNWTVPVS